MHWSWCFICKRLIIFLSVTRWPLRSWVPLQWSPTVVSFICHHASSNILPFMDLWTSFSYLFSLRWEVDFLDLVFLSNCVFSRRNSVRICPFSKRIIGNTCLLQRPTTFLYVSARYHFHQDGVVVPDTGRSRLGGSCSCFCRLPVKAGMERAGGCKESRWVVRTGGWNQ